MYCCNINNELSFPMSLNGFVLCVCNVIIASCQPVSAAAFLDVQNQVKLSSMY